MNLFIYGFNAIMLLGAAWAIFRYVGEEYSRYGKLRPISTFLEVFIFFLHGVLSYVYLDSDPAHIKWRSALTFVGLLSMAIGLIVLLAAMRRLSWGTSSGRELDQLFEDGFYRFSRNPQILGYGIFLLGYALLWPSWSGLLWMMLYFGIAGLMVSTEEKHLRNIFGDAYQDYCERTPRFIGIRKSN